MKTNHLKLLSSFLLSTLLLIGCKKELVQPSDEIASELLGAKSEQGQGCRVTVMDLFEGVIDVHKVDQFTYKEGRVDEWKTYYGIDYEIEYRDNGDLKRARGYDGDVLASTINFFYENGRVTKEIWYAENSNVVIDDYVYTYDRKGQIIKAESTVLGYYTENVYTADGDLESWKFYDAGMPVISGHYTYLNHYKSPMDKGTPGVGHNFPYANSTFGRSKWWYSSEKIIFYDETASPIIYYDEDPLQTQWQIGSSRYPQYVDYVDKLSGMHLGAGFEYENCRNDDAKSIPSHASSSYRGIRKLNPLGLIRNHPSKSIKVQVVELRQRLQQNMNSK